MNADLTNAIDNVLSDERDVREAIASHQAEFPYERADEAQVTRREFCNFLFITSGALLVSTGAFAGKSLYDRSKIEQFAPLEIEGAAELEPGSSLNFFYPGEHDSAILIRTREGGYFAYDQKCTHLTCPVYYSKDHGRLECPCHEGGFDVQTGNVLYGPPPRPLDRIEVEKRGGKVWAIGVIRGTRDEHGEV